MKTKRITPGVAALALVSFFILHPSSLLHAADNPPFVGRITASLTHGQSLPILFTVGTNAVRVEITDTNRPHPINLRDRHSEALTLVFPHNRSFVRLKDSGAHAPSRVPADTLSAEVEREARPAAPEAGALPTPPVVIGPTNLPGVPPVSLPTPPPGAPAALPPGIGPQAGGAPGLAAGPAMPPMPMMPMAPLMMEEPPELKATGQQTNLLGYICQQFELAQRGQRLEIWATDQLLPFPGYLRQQPHRFGPRMLEEQWPELLRTKKLFPLRVSLEERVLFSVTAITPDKMTDQAPKLFQPPSDYHELEPLPF